MLYLYVKSLHIIFVVAWFAALFYLPRLFVYYALAKERPISEQEVLCPQFEIMMKRLWNYITVPAALLTLISGAYLFMQQMDTSAWMIMKIVFVVLLYAYHLWAQKTLRALCAGESPYTARTYRLLNEVPTVLLVAIVFFVVCKNVLDVAWVLIALIAFALLLFFVVRAIKWKEDKLK